MAKNSSSSGNSGIGFIGLLTIVFITLKLTHEIDWSWWWVLSPLWVGPTVLVVVVLVIAVFCAIVEALTETFK